MASWEELVFGRRNGVEVPGGIRPVARKKGAEIAQEVPGRRNGGLFCLGKSNDAAMSLNKVKR